jgi:hypothetical protein
MCGNMFLNALMSEEARSDHEKEQKDDYDKKIMEYNLKTKAAQEASKKPRKPPPVQMNFGCFSSTQQCFKTSTGSGCLACKEERDLGLPVTLVPDRMSQDPQATVCGCAVCNSQCNAVFKQKHLQAIATNKAYILETKSARRNQGDGQPTFATAITGLVAQSAHQIQQRSQQGTPPSLDDVATQISFDVSRHPFPVNQAQEAAALLPPTTNFVGGHHVASFGPRVEVAQASRSVRNDLTLPDARSTFPEEDRAYHSPLRSSRTPAAILGSHEKREDFHKRVSSRMLTDSRSGGSAGKKAKGAFVKFVKKDEVAVSIVDVYANKPSPSASVKETEGTRSANATQDLYMFED